jgi:hypothetical protein
VCTCVDSRCARAWVRGRQMRFCVVRRDPEDKRGVVGWSEGWSNKRDVHCKTELVPGVTYHIVCQIQPNDRLATLAAYSPLLPQVQTTVAILAPQ